MEIKESHGNVTFKKKLQRRKIVMFFTIFTLVWNGVTWPLIPQIYDKISEGKDLMMLLLIGHPIIGLIVFYYTLTLYFNKLNLKIGPREASTSVGPLPWIGNYIVKRSDVQQVYVEQYIAYYYNGNAIRHFGVKAILSNENIHCYIIKGLQRYEEALIIEKTIEEKWSIEDERVKEEYQSA